MKFTFARDMQRELLAVDDLFKNSLCAWWDDITVYIENIKQDFTYNVLPAMVIVAYRDLGLNNELSLAMANLFKTIYFANCIHVLVKDDEEGQKQNQELQFTILIGDYIFGRILKLLLETKAEGLLPQFSGLMCEINEGMVIKYKIKTDLHQVVAKSRASLYTTAFITAAELAHLDAKMVAMYGEIGRNIGMALELGYCYGQDVSNFLYEAQRLGKQFSAVTGSGVLLGNIVEELLEDITSFHAVAVG